MHIVIYTQIPILSFGVGYLDPGSFIASFETTAIKKYFHKRQD